MPCVMSAAPRPTFTKVEGTSGVDAAISIASCIGGKDFPAANANIC